MLTHGAKKYVSEVCTQAANKPEVNPMLAGEKHFTS
jgi:hypothetical protein